MLHSRRENAEKDKKVVFGRDIVTKNPVFTKEHCEEFFQMFDLYCDNHRQCDVSDILNTARTLGFEKKYRVVYDALAAVAADLNGEWVNFQTFLTHVTNKVGNPFSENGRRAMFDLVDLDRKQSLLMPDLRRISQQLRFNLSDEQLQQVVNNVSGFGKKQIGWEQFNRYIAKKVDKR